MATALGVNVLDVVLVIVAISAAVGGYRLGFIARAASWLGLAVGVTAGALVLPGLLHRVQDASDVTVILIAIASPACWSACGCCCPRWPMSPAGRPRRRGGRSSPARSTPASPTPRTRCRRCGG